MDEQTPSIQGLVCPTPLAHNDMIVLGHGSGGRLMHNLISRHFLPRFSNPILDAGDDAGCVLFETGSEPSIKLAIATDSHVVWPLFFPGGDIGRLAICGTVNDVAMLGARPQYITAGFILEEGLSLQVLEDILSSMQQAAAEAGVQIVAGDTKVVQKGKADGIYINTSGVGIINPQVHISGSMAKPGDVILLSGSIGDHGIAVLEARGELGFSAGIRSDVAPLNHMITSLIEAGCELHTLRDPTRGGLATTLNEIAGQSRTGVLIDETAILVKPAVKAACEMLGFDPLYIANEGKLVAIVAKEDADRALQIMHKNPYGVEASIIGQIQPYPAGKVLLKTAIGTTRVVDVLAGEILPRIC